MRKFFWTMLALTGLCSVMLLGTSADAQCTVRARSCAIQTQPLYTPSAAVVAVSGPFVTDVIPITPVYAATFIPVPLLIPIATYGVGYAPPSAGTPQLVPAGTPLAQQQAQIAGPAPQGIQPGLSGPAAGPAPCAEMGAKVLHLEAQLAAMQSGDVPPLKLEEPPPAVKETATVSPQAQPQGKTGGGSHVAVFVAECSRCHERAVSAAKGGGFTLLNGGQVVPLTEKQRLRIIARVHDSEMPPGKKLDDTAYSNIVVGLASIN